MSPSKKSYSEQIISALAPLVGFQKMSRSALFEALKKTSSSGTSVSRPAFSRALKSLVATGKLQAVKGSFKLNSGVRDAINKKNVKKTASEKKKTVQKPKTAKSAKKSKVVKKNKVVKKSPKKTITKKPDQKSKNTKLAKNVKSLKKTISKKGSSKTVSRRKI